MKVILKKQKISKKFNIVFPAKAICEYSEDLQSIEHPTKKGVWIRVSEKEIIKLKPRLFVKAQEQLIEIDVFARVGDKVHYEILGLGVTGQLDKSEVVDSNGAVVDMKTIITVIEWEY